MASGILDFMSPSIGQPPGFMSRASSFREQNPGALTALGAGLMNGNMGQGFALAAPIISENKRNNMTAQYIIKKGLASTPEEAMALAQNPVILADLMKGDDIISAGKGRLYNKTKNTWLTDPMAPAGGEVDYSQIPQYYRNKDGSYGIGVLGDNGTFKPVDLGGAEPLGPYGTALDKHAGAGEGDALVTYRSMTSKMPGLENVVQQLYTLSDQATYTPGGQLLDAGMRWADMEPRDSAVARTKYMAMVDNQILPMLRDTFGAQFTEREGQTLRDTMGDANKTPAEKKAVLDAFIQQKRRDIEALAIQTGQTGQSVSPPGAGGWTVEKVQP